MGLIIKIIIIVAIINNHALQFRKRIKILQHTKS